MSLRLYQFEFSHFCEKARWTLDYKRIAYEKVTLLPGFHVPKIRAMTGQPSVPVLETPDERIVGSDAIAEYAERIGRGPALFPANEGARTEALAIQARFEPIGHHARRALFAVLFADPPYALACMTGTAQSAGLYAKTFFLTRRVIAKLHDLSPAAVEASTQATLEALDFVAEKTAGREYLVGDTFTIADLTAAALLIPACMPKGAQVPVPQPRPDSLAEHVARFADHPATSWVARMFERHRMLDVGRAE